MYRTASIAARTCNRFASRPIVNKRGFALVNDISVRKRMTIGLSGFAVVAVGTFYGCRAVYRNRKAKKMAKLMAAKEVAPSEPVMPVIPPTETPEVVSAEVHSDEVAVSEPVVEKKAEEVESAAEMSVAEESTTEAVPTTEAVSSVVSDVEEEKYHPWWEGVKEVSVFLSSDEIDMLDSKFPATRSYKSPQRKVMLAYNPKPEDANEFGPVLGDEVEMKVLAMVSDEHAQVLVLDIGDVESCYRYPHIVLSCDDEDRTSAYSSVYGRLLVDRAVMDGLLVEESMNVYIPKEDIENVEVEGYYSYPVTHVSVKDLRSEGIVLKGKLCTSRGMDCEKYECMEAKNDRECSWCVFMKSGPCFKPFELWQKCILANQSDADSFIKNCGEITMTLKDCVDAHPEYYGNLSQPQREAEAAKAAAEEATEVTAEEVTEVPTEVTAEDTIEEVSEVTTDRTMETETIQVSPAPEESLPESEVPTINPPTDNSSA